MEEISPEDLEGCAHCRAGDRQQKDGFLRSNKFYNHVRLSRSRKKLGLLMQSSPTYSAVKLHLSESDRIFRTGGAHLERGYRDIARTSYAYSFGTVISILLDIVRVGGPSDRRVYRGFHRCQTIAVFRESKSFLYYTLLVYSFLQAINFNWKLFNR